ncbi:DNA-3-methyladenine glycosylase I [Patulibacter sp.]|uniref:DNA-3-methyladenine glycosylase I n=1 Tax=Patulibacter sp. TaxID=1912859 RepID=UPI00271CFF48|nr:DNA-3-methyladenine glycosylase I [Patulibacter sp.]MDO9406905.1 DNA-3-methyladenine glycosylase I [Patulibacter sp.]
MTDDLTRGDDDEARCAWADGPELLRRHHDEEWGRPLHGERPLFELLTLVTFGSGLSWLTVLRKREAFRAAFGGFDPDVVAAYGPADLTRLLADAGIVRNRRKIEAATRNARATVGLRADGGLDALVWSYADAARDERPSPGWRPASRAEVPSTTAASRALGGELRTRGFTLVGPTVAYALLQTAGVVDDHLAGCAAARTRGEHVLGATTPV